MSNTWSFGAFAGSLARDRKKAFGIGGLALLVALVALAIALGGGSDSHNPTVKGVAVTQAGQPGVPDSATSTTGATHRSAATNNYSNVGSVPALAPQTAPSVGAAPTDGLASTGGGASVAAGVPTRVIGSDSAAGVDATRIVKTGELQLRVAKGSVQSTMNKLSDLATTHGGYVAASNTDTNPTSPSGDITLRIPVGQFAAAVSAAQRLGHVESLSTAAKDVTGKYVDLNARKHALERTRATYLTILSRATTIGATLSVQQRIDDVQQQIDELHGQLKLLASQSAFSTLDVRVDQPGPIAVTKVTHERHGLDKAWHTSIHRFTRGIDAIVAAIGPLLLAILLIGIGYGLVRLGSRRVRRYRSSNAAG